MSPLAFALVRGRQSLLEDLEISNRSVGPTPCVDLDATGAKRWREPITGAEVVLSADLPHSATWF